MLEAILDSLPPTQVERERLHIAKTKVIKPATRARRRRLVRLLLALGATLPLAPAAVGQTADASLPPVVCRLLPNRPDLALAIGHGRPGADADGTSGTCGNIFKQPTEPATRTARFQRTRGSALSPPRPPADSAAEPPRTDSDGTDFPSAMRLRTRRNLMRSESSLIDRTRVELHNRIYRRD